MAIGISLRIPRIEIDSPRFASDQALLRIAGGSAFLFIATFFGLGLNYLYAVVLARVLGPEQFGLYALGLGCFNLLSVIALAGLDSAVLRFVPALRAQNDARGIASVIRSVLALSSGLSVICAIVLVMSSDTIAIRFFHNHAVSTVLSVFALSIPLMVVSSIYLAVLQAFREVGWRLSVKYLCEPVVRFAATLGMIWMGWSLMAALVALPIALCLTTILAVLPLRGLLSIGRQSASKGNAYKSVLEYSLPLLGGLVFAGIATRSDVLFLGHSVSLDQV